MSKEYYYYYILLFDAKYDFTPYEGVIAVISNALMRFSPLDK